MKHRITYLRDAQDPSFDPRQCLKVWKNSMRISDLQAAKEHRVTLDASELPSEFRKQIQHLGDAHIRWTSPNPYHAAVPLVSRVSPGLHVQYTSAEPSSNVTICSAMQSLWGPQLDCGDFENGRAIPMRNEGSTTASNTHHHYSLEPPLGVQIPALGDKLCPHTDDACHQLIKAVPSASYFDIDFDQSTDIMTINMYWANGRSNQAWNEVVDFPHHERVEVGVLNRESTEERDEIKMGGWLTVLGHDLKPKPTLFSFPSRHHNLPASSSSNTSSSNTSATFAPSLLHPTGLHPTLQLSLSPSSLHPPPAHDASSCKLHTHLTLPSHLFIDRHTFTDALVLHSHNLAGLNSLTGATDLEAPVWAVREWGSVALFEIATVSNTFDADGSSASASTSATVGRGLGGGLNVTIPLHLRYMTPTAGGYQDASIPYPVVFWACEHSSPNSGASAWKPNGNPFDRRQLGYDALFGADTVFYHVEPHVTASGSVAGRHTLSMRVPVLDMDKAWYVEPLTAVVVLLGVGWVFWKLFRPLGAPQRQQDKAQIEGKKVR